jgi:outer membrane immunogenic protein
MRRLLPGVAVIAALVTSLGLGTAALAADMAPAYMPLKAPPPPIWTWTGFYIGGNAGYSWGKANWTYGDPSFTGTNSGSQSLDGFIGGLQIGYNWQLNPTWVLGLEADLQGSAEKGSNSFSDPYFCDVCAATADTAYVNGSVSSDIRWFGTARGRLGWLLNPTLMLYGTGGLAYGGISTSGAFSDTFPGCSPSICNWGFGQTTTRLGWTVGGGIEGAIANSSNWTWKIEYLYVDFGTLSGSSFGADPLAYSWSTHVTDNILRVGVNYIFH